MVLIAIPAAAQQPAANDSRAMIRAGFNEIADRVLQAAELASQEQYSYRPVATVRTLGEQIGHLADAFNWYCGNATRQTEWNDNVEKNVHTKAALIQALRQARERCNPVYAAPASRVDQLLGNVAHTHQHYGNIVTYLRMLGLTPPAS